MKQVNLGFYRMVLFLLLGLFTSVIAYSQQISVKGIVKDQIGEPVIGANVLVRGTTNGVITNVNGEFILSASKSDVLVVSFVGYTTQEIPVSEKQMTIVLKEDTELLDEVVVLGYGANTRKQDLSASVGIISRPLKSAHLRNIVRKQYPADFFNKPQKSPHGSFEVVCGGS